MSDTAQPERNRPELSPFVLNALVATYLMALCNSTFWGHLFRIFEGRTLTALVLSGAVWALMLFIVSLLAVRRIQKPVLVAMLITAGVTSYYVDVLGVVVDREMIQNAMTTTFAESKHLITLQFITHVFLYGVIPSLLVLWVRVRRASTGRALIGYGVVGALSVALLVGLLFTNLKAYSTVLRGNKELMGSVQPLAPMGGALRYAKMMFKSTQIVVAPTGRDAKPGPFLAKVDKPVLMVVVAGETGRAQNWSLSGYERETNAELKTRDIIYYSNASSCGTATATSLPCMFSPLTRAEYSYEGGLGNENLLDVLLRAGFDVEWWDNNTGDKNIGDRLPVRPYTMKSTDGAEFCFPECIDAVFLKKLQDKADTITKDTVIVLHQIGSHGPSYWLRYPPEKELFKPACQTPELTECSTDEIVNAYDNTIAYTDWFLAQLIDQLDASDRVNTAMYYVSDHGESLGEAGLYLHGTPYFMAPENQTRVPMVIWMSQRFRDSLGIDQDCLKAKSADPVSHDNMFSTVLGMVDVTTEARDATLDLASVCRQATTG